jgi:hypothetical protein
MHIYNPVLSWFVEVTDYAASNLPNVTLLDIEGKWYEMEL